MRISWNWLQQYVATDRTPEVVASVLTSTGLEVEGITPYEPVKGMLKGVVVGHVVACEKHREADRLSLCQVELGDGEPVQIVCGAPNVAAGQKVLVATVGSELQMSNGECLTIKKSKIRGQVSNGMICAEDELGLGQGHDGILVLDPSAKIGRAASEELGLVADQVLEIGLTPNRTDAMGHVGVARDLVAAINYREQAELKLTLPSVDAYAQDDSMREVKVELRAPEACTRYAGVTLTNIKVGPSPQWLQERLLAIGLKPINNVVDVTNYVQHELAQPLHAFDADKLEGDRIVVRLATKDEPFTTLDEKQRKLDPNDLVIADASAPACIAGVFGGLVSGVSERTSNVFLESACFDPAFIRRTSRRHGLNTDASFRFERGVDPEITVYALKRAVLLLKEVAGARVSSAITDLRGTPRMEREVSLGYEEFFRLTGLRIAPEAIVKILELLECRIVERSSEALRVVVPSYRIDVTRPADLIEEVLRIHGFDQVPIPERAMYPPVIHDMPSLESLRRHSADHLAARGLREIMTPSLVSGERCLANGTGTEGSLVGLANPLSSELDVLRPNMIFGALQAMAHNLNRQQRDLRFFERGRIYGRKEGRTIEVEMLSIAVTGRRYRERWRSAEDKADLFDVKAEVESLMERLGLMEATSWEPMEHPLLEHANAFRIDGTSCGVVGEVRRSVRKQFDVGQPAFIAEIDEGVLLHACRHGKVEFAELNRFPSVRRDLSLMLDEQVKYDRLKALAFQAERKLLHTMDLFDVYTGDKLPKGKKSYALSFILRDNAKTLTDEQVDKAMGRIRQAYEKELGAELRS